MDEAWELPVRQCLNDLAYLKAKGQHEKELIEQWKKSLR
jgi:hypothetical protein